MNYFLTFSCYGQRLHGDSKGSVSRDRNVPGSPLIEQNEGRVTWEGRKMGQEPYVLDASRRAHVLAALQQRCQDRGWTLKAAHVRTTHVHVVVESDAAPEQVLNQLKSSASRELNLRGCDPEGRKRWAYHGSTRWLWDQQDVDGAVRYVVDGQGEPMAVYRATE